MWIGASIFLPGYLDVCMRNAVLSLCLFGSTAAFAQVLPYPAYAPDANAPLRLALRAGAETGVQLGMQPFTYRDVRGMLARADSTGSEPGMRETWQQAQVRARLADLPERVREERAGLRGFLNRNFYQEPGQAIALRKEGFSLFVNPVLDFMGGAQRDLATGSLVFTNTRGLTARGSVDGRVFFQTTFTDNQARLLSWEQEWRELYDDRVPGVGFYKLYSSTVLDSAALGAQGVDYVQATGEVGFNVTKHISFRFGHGNPRAGTGYRSLILDDFADRYLYAQLDTRVWRIHYRNLYTQLQDGVQSFDRVSRKYLVSHTLGLQITPSLEIGLSEQTVFARENGNFDAQYLNPIILYRAVEGDNGSPDNALIGLYANLRLGASAVLYGQLVFDEFKFSELTDDTGWWANKWSGQLGGRWFDAAGIAGLDLGVEANTIRPFTYAHRRPRVNYTHYSQPLAHPWGADLQELHVEAAYRFAPRWRFATELTSQKQGLIVGQSGQPVGSIILVNNDDRILDYGYSGTANDPATGRRYLSLGLEYSPIPGSQLFVKYVNYSRDDAVSGENLSQQGFTAGLSLNTVRRSRVF